VNYVPYVKKNQIGFLSKSNYLIFKKKNLILFI